MRGAIAAVVAVAVAASGVSAGGTTATSTSTANPTSTPTPTPNPTSNPTSTPIPVRPAADAAKLALETGRGRPAVLHFWATWCDACREEFPRLRKLLNGLPARKVGVLLVSIDRPEKLADVERDLRRFGVGSLPAVVLDAPDPDPVAKAVGDPRWDGTLPSTFVFDGEGRLRRSFIGRTDPGALEMALRTVR